MTIELNWYTTETESTNLGEADSAYLLSEAGESTAIKPIYADDPRVIDFNNPTREETAEGGKYNWSQFLTLADETAVENA